MKIYTKTGDKGQTSLVSGERVPKNHLRIEAYGTVDELNACLGVMKDSATYQGLHERIEDLQSLLFSIGSHLAATEKNKMPLPELHEEDILADKIDEMAYQLRGLNVQNGVQSAIYVVGLSEFHDVDFMNELAQSGSYTGNFIFVDRVYGYLGPLM